jgi:hypothetical protein
LALLLPAGPDAARYGNEVLSNQLQSNANDMIAAVQDLNLCHNTRIETGRAMTELSFKTLLYRYFFFGWLFRDVNRGDMYERSNAWRHNLQQARWLATYLRRWLMVGAITYGLGEFCESLLEAPLLSAVFYVPMAVSVSINTVIGSLMIGFKLLASSGPL